MSDLNVLYDAPGPRARVRNALYTALFLAALVAAGWWVYGRLSDRGELEWRLWEPIFTDSRLWTNFVLPGLQDTLIAAGLSMVIALPLGALLGIGRLSDHRWIRVPVGAVVEFFRAIPVLLLMLFANEAYFQWSSVTSDLRPLYAVVTGLVMYNASVLAEVVRAGVLALPRGQSDAARAIGMRKGQIMVSVLLPQAVTAMLPAIVSQLVVIVKDTALGGQLVQYTELRSTIGDIDNNFTSLLAAFTLITVIYVVLNFLLTSFAGWLERRIRRGRRTTGAVLTTDMTDELAAAGDVPGPGAAGGTAEAPRKGRG